LELQGVVVNMKRIRLSGAVVILFLAVGCGAGDVRLAAPVSCSGLETIRLGAERDVVLAAAQPGTNDYERGVATTVTPDRWEAREKPGQT
jgi:hypothetical protein